MLPPIQSPIIAAEVRPVTLRLHTPFKIALSDHSIARNVLVILRDEQGHEGIGEAAPLPALTGDNHETVKAALDQMTNTLSACIPNQYQDCFDMFRRDFSQTPTAVAAIEMALWDLSTRQKGISLARMWHAEPFDTVKTDITVPIIESTELAVFLERMRHLDFTSFKFKVGGKPDQDLERIQAVEKAMADKFTFTLDGNQGFTHDGALKLLEQLEKLGLSPLFFEQPLPEDDWQGLASLTRTSSVPICADESIKTIADAQRAVNEKMCHIINLKVTKSGVRDTLGIIEVARQSRIPLMIGGMVETEVAMTFSLHLACGTKATTYFDLDTPFFFEQRITKSSPYHDNSATLTLPNSPGIGLDLLG